MFTMLLSIKKEGTTEQAVSLGRVARRVLHNQLASKRRGGWGGHMELQVQTCTELHQCPQGQQTP